MTVPPRTPLAGYVCLVAKRHVVEPFELPMAVMDPGPCSRPIRCSVIEAMATGHTVVYGPIADDLPAAIDA
jgi:hypothetical protein